MIPISDLFIKDYDVNMGLRGDPYLWRDMTIAINYQPIPSNSRELEQLLYKLFHQLTGMELNPQRYGPNDRNRRVDRYGSMGMSGGYVCHTAWQERLIPLVLKRYNKKIKKGAEFGIVRNALTEFSYRTLTVCPQSPEEYRYTVGIRGDHTLFVIALGANKISYSAEKRLIARVVTVCKKFGFDSFALFNLSPWLGRVKQPDEDGPDRRIIVENASTLNSIIPEFDHSKGPSNVLATWGDGIEKDFVYRYSLMHIIDHIDKEKRVNWLKLGELTSKGHPRNILGAPYGLQLTEFGIRKYFDKISEYSH